MYLNRKSIAAVFMLFVLLAGCKSMPVVVTNPYEIEAMAEKYRNNIVQITTRCQSKSETEDGNGFGFVIGENNGFVYIVTAKHVICNNNPDKKEIQISFYKADDPVSAMLIDDTSNYDIAILKAKKPTDNYTWKRECYDTHANQGDNVWFIGREKEWKESPKAGTILDKSSKANSFLYQIIDMPGVKCGTSGAPLFRNQGIIGMITEDKGDKTIALDIDIIRYQVKSSKKSATWDMTNCQGKDTAITKVEIDKVKEDIKSKKEASEKDNIKQILAKADSYLKESKYIEPKDDNAFDMYKEVLKVDSNNPEALQGILRLMNIHKEIFNKEVYSYVRLIKDEQLGKNVKADIVRNINKIIKTLEDSKTICTYYIEHQKDQDEETKWLCDEIKKHKDEYQKKLDARLK